MSEAYNLITIAQSNETASEIEAVISTIDGLAGDVRPRRNGAPILETLSGAETDILLVELDLADDKSVRELERIVQSGDARATLVTSTNATVQDIRALMRLGVQDYIPQPISRDDLVATLKETISQLTKGQNAGGMKDGKIITFLRSCGGAGATTLALQTAAGLKSQPTESDPLEVGVLDFDLQFGNVDLSLDLVPTSSILDILDSGSRLDPSLLIATMTSHHSGIHVLTSPKEIFPLDAMSSSTATSTLKTARKAFDFTIVDMPHTWTNWTQPVLGASDLVFLVMEPNVTSVHRTQKMLDAMRGLDLEDVPLAIVANKAEAGLTGRQRIAEASEALKRDIKLTIQNDYRNVEDARNRGILLKDHNDNSPALKDMGGLTSRILSDFRPELMEMASVKSESLFNRFRRK